MFSSLVKGNGTWDGRLELFEDDFEKSSLDALFPSILKTSNPGAADHFYQQNDKTTELTDNVEQPFHLCRLPKTYLTRKGAIVLYTSLGKTNQNYESQQHCKQHCKHEHCNDYGCPELKTGIQGQHFNYVSRGKKKDLLNFLAAFVNEQSIDKKTTSDNSKEPSCQAQQEKSLLKTLSSPSLQCCSVGSRKASMRRRANTAVPTAVPPEPEQPKAHPRITSAKPRPPTRTLGKVQIKNVRSQSKREASPSVKKVVMDSSSPEAKTIHYDEIRIPRASSESQLEHADGISRASSASRYSSWWTRDDVPLSYYDNNLNPPGGAKQDRSRLGGDDNTEFAESIECTPGGRRDSVTIGGYSMTVGGHSVNRPASSVWSSVWENFSDSGVPEVGEDIIHTGFQDGEMSRISSSVSSRCPSANLPCSEKFTDDEISEMSFQVCAGDPDFEEIRSVSSPPGNGTRKNTPRPASCRSQVYTSEQDLELENDNATFLGIGGGISEDCFENVSSKCDSGAANEHFMNNPDSESSQFRSRNDDSALENDSVSDDVRNAYGVKHSSHPETSKSQVSSRRGSGSVEDHLVNNNESSGNSQFCSGEDDSILTNDRVSDGPRNASGYGNSRVCSNEQEFRKTLEKDDGWVGNGPESKSSRFYSFEDDLFVEDSDVVGTDETEADFRNSQDQEDFDVEKNTRGVSRRSSARTVSDSRNSRAFSGGRGPEEHKPSSPVENCATNRRTHRVRSAPNSRTTSDARHSQRFWSRTSFSAGSYRSLPREPNGYVGNATSPTPPQIAIRVPSANSVHENYDEERTEDVLEHAHVAEPNSAEFGKTENVETTKEFNFVRSVSSSPVVVDDNGNENEKLCEMAVCCDETVASPVTDDAAELGQDVNDPKESRQLSGEHQEDSDDDDDSLAEASHNIPQIITQLEKAPVERQQVKPSSDLLRASNSPTESGKLLRNPPKANEKPNSAKKNERQSVAENAENIRGPKKRSVIVVKKEKDDGENLDVQGVGKNEGKILGGVKGKVEVNVKNKVDLSDLKQLIGKNSTTKTKKPVAKKSRSLKPTRKKNLAEDSESNLDVIPIIDENLLKALENQDGGIELTDEALDQFAPVENFEDPDLSALPEDTPLTKPGSYSPSKVRKATRKGTVRKRKDSTLGKKKEAEEQRKKRNLEEKERREEELRLLKEREDEQRRLLEEVKEKQRTIEEEKDKRLKHEAQARKLEEQAEAELRETKRKANEEREKRREEEAERRKKEVERKREEKRNRELEIQKREKELQKQRVDREERMAELQAQRERERELEKMAEEQKEEEERLHELELEEERKLEEARIREAEETLQQKVREREYREEMRRIAEVQQAKLEKQETERCLKELQERAAIQEERARLEREHEQRENEERARIRELRKHEAMSRIRAAHEAAKRRAWALQRREKNMNRMAHLKVTRQSQKLTEAFTFTYHVHVPRTVWELPYNWNSKKKRSFRPPARKKKPSKE